MGGLYLHTGHGLLPPAGHHHRDHLLHPDQPLHPHQRGQAGGHEGGPPSSSSKLQFITICRQLGLQL